VPAWFYGFMDCVSATKFFGRTRMMPPRRPSPSAMNRNAIDPMVGKTKKRCPFGARHSQPSGLEAIAIISIITHAATGIRFHQAAWV